MMGGGGEILCSNPIFPAPPLAKGLWGDTVSPVQRSKPEPDLETQGHCSVQVDSTCWFSDGHKQDSHVTKDFICGRREKTPDESSATSFFICGRSVSTMHWHC